MSVLELDYKNKNKVQDFISSVKRDVTKYTAEYNGDRKIRDLQIGHRDNIRQGKKIIEAERLTINFQKKIVQTAASFLFGEHPDISITGEENEKSKKVLQAFRANRINNKLYDFAEEVMSSTIAAFIFAKEGDEVKARLYTNENGDFIPKYDPYGDLEAVIWQWRMEDYDNIWIFTKDFIHKYQGKEGEIAYQKEESTPHDFGVIPVVFEEQKEPEWFDVKELIDRIEMLISKLAGSNNYFAFPILGFKNGAFKNEKGEVETIVDVSDDGKSIAMGYAINEGHLIEADAKFIQRDTGVDSIKLEMECLKEMIFNISRTPNLSFDNVKGIGAIGEKALKLMLQDAINKAKAKQNQYQITIERILNVISAGQGNKEKFEFDINFNLSLPNDLKEDIETLLEATGGHAILSQETGIKQNPKVKDAVAELQKIKKEEAQRSGYGLNNTDNE